MIRSSRRALHTDLGCRKVKINAPSPPTPSLSLEERQAALTFFLRERVRSVAEREADRVGGGAGENSSGVSRGGLSEQIDAEIAGGWMPKARAERNSLIEAHSSKSARCALAARPVA